MKLNLVRTDGFRFIPATDDDMKKALKIRKGEVVEVSVKVLRNYAFHRKFFKLIEVAWNYLTEPQQKIFENSMNGFRYSMEVAAGYYEDFYDIGRQTLVRKPKSISFDKMDEAEFSELYDAVANTIFTLFLDDNRVDRDTFYNALKDF